MLCLGYVLFSFCFSDRTNSPSDARWSSDAPPAAQLLEKSSKEKYNKTSYILHILTIYNVYVTQNSKYYFGGEYNLKNGKENNLIKIEDTMKKSDNVRSTNLILRHGEIYTTLFWRYS